MRLGRTLKVPFAVLPVAYLLRVLRLPVRGWQPSDESQGVGPLTRRRYWLDVEGAQLTPEETIRQLLQGLPAHLPPLLARFRRVDQAERPTRVGDRFTVLMFGLRRGRVEVAGIGERSFRLQTLRQHTESGWLEFRAVPLDGGRVRLETESCMRSSSWFDRAAALLGVGILQRLTWEAGLRRTLQTSGGRKVHHGTSTLEWP